MNKKQILIIIGIILIISVISIFVFNHYITVRNFELENTPSQLDTIFKKCACKERVKASPETNIRCTASLVDWQNSTHYIDNNLCEFITLEEHYNNQK